MTATPGIASLWARTTSVRITGTTGGTELHLGRVSSDLTYGQDGQFPLAPSAGLRNWLSVRDLCQPA